MQISQEEKEALIRIVLGTICHCKLNEKNMAETTDEVNAELLNFFDENEGDTEC